MSFRQAPTSVSLGYRLISMRQPGSSHEVPMEGVHLVLGHQVDEVLDLVLVEEVARDVQHQPPPAESRLVFDLHGRHGPRDRFFHLGRAEDLRRQELQQRLHPVEQARPIGGGNHHAVRASPPKCSLRRRGAALAFLARQQDGVRRRPGAICGDTARFQARAAVDPIGQLLCRRWPRRRALSTRIFVSLVNVNAPSLRIRSATAAAPGRSMARLGPAACQETSWPRSGNMRLQLSWEPPVWKWMVAGS